jgi:hypothetical protein
MYLQMNHNGAGVLALNLQSQYFWLVPFIVIVLPVLASGHKHALLAQLTLLMPSLNIECWYCVV